MEKGWTPLVAVAARHAARVVAALDARTPSVEGLQGGTVARCSRVRRPASPFEPNPAPNPKPTAEAAELAALVRARTAAAAAACALSQEFSQTQPDPHIHGPPVTLKRLSGQLADQLSHTPMAHVDEFLRTIGLDAVSDSDALLLCDHLGDFPADVIASLLRVLFARRRRTLHAVATLRALRRVAAVAPLAVLRALVIPELSGQSVIPYAAVAALGAAAGDALGGAAAVAEFLGGELSLKVGLGLNAHALALFGWLYDTAPAATAWHLLREVHHATGRALVDCFDGSVLGDSALRALTAAAASVG